MSVDMKKRDKKLSLSMVVILALLIAIEIVLSRFLSIAQWNIKFSFSFIPVVVAAILYGPIASAIVGGVSDFLGAILFPIGAYFPGFTLTSALVGMIFGLFLHRKQSMTRIVASTLITQTFCSLLLNSFWISVLYGSNFIALLSTRWLQCIVMSVVTIIVVSIVSYQLMPRIKTAIVK